MKYGNHISIHVFTTNLYRWEKIKSVISNTFENNKKYKLLKCYSLIRKKAILYLEKNKNFIKVIDEIKNCSINDMEHNLNLLHKKNINLSLVIQNNNRDNLN